MSSSTGKISVYPGRATIPSDAINPQVVQGVSTDIDGIQASYSITMTGATAGNSLLYCVSGDKVNMGVSSVADNHNGAYTFIPDSYEGAHNTMQAHYLLGLSNFTGSLIATSTAANFNGVIQYFIEISGYPNGFVPDSAAVNNGSSGNPSVTLTTLTDGCLIVAFVRADGFIAIGAGWTKASDDSNGDVSQWKVQPTAGAITIPFVGDGNPWAVTAVALKAAS